MQVVCQAFLHRWSKEFSPGHEIHLYAKRMAAELNLNQHIKLNTRATFAKWNEGSSTWTVSTDVKGYTLEADLVLQAAGPLTVPKKPKIEVEHL